MAKHKHAHWYFSHAINIYENRFEFLKKVISEIFFSSDELMSAMGNELVSVIGSELDNKSRLLGYEEIGELIKSAQAKILECSRTAIGTEFGTSEEVLEHDRE